MAKDSTQEPQEGRKVCKTCYGKIDARAIACPHCGSWQDPRRYLFILPFCLVAAGAGMYIGFAVRGRAMAALPLTSWELGAVPYRQQLAVSESKMYFGTSPDGPAVYVIGKVANESDLAWMDIKMDVEFRDPEGGLLDVEVRKGFADKILPRGEMAFKFTSLLRAPREQYDSYSVAIRSARSVQVRSEK